MRTTTTLIIAILAASFAASSAWAAQSQGEGAKENNVQAVSIGELVRDLKAAKTEQEKTAVLNKKGSGGRPQNLKDVEDLMDLATTSKSSMDRSFALDGLGRVPPNKEFATPFLRALDSDDRDVRVVAMRNLRRMKHTGALPHIRRILRDYNSMAFKAAKLVDKRKARAIASEGSEAALFLAEQRDNEGLNILLEKIEGLENGGCTALGRYGKMALPRILELARDRKKKDYGMGALVQIEDKDAEDELIQIVEDVNEDGVIRQTATHALVTRIKSDKFLDRLEGAVSTGQMAKYEKVLPYACRHSGNKRGAAILAKYLAQIPDGSYDGLLKRQLVITYLGEMSNPVAVPALESQLKHQNKDIRELAAFALKQITGRDYPWSKP
ncbi:MAG: hypothetical protein HY924_06355 [Elusimicrobia bacterium]|nr:hypothetical protein [Elusimicrobiota bacterium]